MHFYSIIQENNLYVNTFKTNITKEFISPDYNNQMIHKCKKKHLKDKNPYTHQSIFK
ncbi:hypothetical protein JCM10003_1580 [Bacteroides pyogenes JCM 10003]|nr:hypothetical protein JCM10003_1580 [Bacteroides pyogenes JCM 10003]